MRRIRFVGVRILLFAVVAAAVVGLLVLALWNGLMPSIFGLPTITFWQALGLFVLGRLLFGGFGCGGRRGRWRPRFAKGWDSLTPEERQRFREAMGPRCGGGGEEA